MMFHCSHYPVESSVGFQSSLEGFLGFKTRWCSDAAEFMEAHYWRESWTPVQEGMPLYALSNRRQWLCRQRAGVFFWLGFFHYHAKQSSLLPLLSFSQNEAFIIYAFAVALVVVLPLCLSKPRIFYSLLVVKWFRMMITCTSCCCHHTENYNGGDKGEYCWFLMNEICGWCGPSVCRHISTMVVD